MNRRHSMMTLAMVGIAEFALPAVKATESGSVIANFGPRERGLDWQIVNDSVMGGVSTSRMENSAGGIARFTGRLSLENNGGFASFRSAGRLPDLTGHDAVVLRVKGDGRRYQFRIRTETGWRAPNYSAEFQTENGKWREYRLPFADFVAGWRGRTLRDVPPIDLTRIRSIGILLGDKKPGSFALEIDWIKAAKIQAVTAQ
jgi:NADH dehydrogenase [ubiquinone] 1 alpha subcomplex assembly factor 1